MQGPGPEAHGTRPHPGYCHCMDDLGPQTDIRPIAWPDGGHQKDPPVTVRTFSREDEMMPVVAFLNAEGVPTYQPDSNILKIDPALFVALGFYKLQVPTSLRERAMRLLIAWDNATPLPPDADTGFELA